MERKLVKSSQVAEVGYDEVAKLLEIKFQSGGLYQYAGVPQAIYDALMRAVSPGHYFAVEIRANYPCERLHIAGCDPIALPSAHETANCQCWCHRLVKSTPEEKPNENLKKDLEKSIKKAKQQKEAVTERAKRNRIS